jgi:hypothetical protein
MMILQEQQKTTRKLHAVSAYASSSWQLDINNNVDVHDEKRVFVESISIMEMLFRFNEQPSVKAYGIISAYIWDTETREIIEYITDLPDTQQRDLMKLRKMSNLHAQLEALQEQYENL